MTYSRQDTNRLLGVREEKSGGMFLGALGWLGKKIFGTIVFMLVTYGAAYGFLMFNPELKARVTGMIDQSLGALSTLSQMQQQTAAAEGDASAAPSSNFNQLIAMAQSLTKKSSGSSAAPDSIPYALEPMIEALKGTKDFERYRAQLTVANVGEKGDGALPILLKALNSKSPKLQEAARASLARMDSPVAKSLASGGAKVLR